MTTDNAALNRQKMIDTCRTILDSCAKSFVWEDDISPYHDNKKPFNLIFPHPEIYKELLELLEKFSGKPYLYDQVMATCTLVEEWSETGTYGLDRDFSRVFSKYSLKPEYVEQIKAYFSKRLEELLTQNV